MCCTLQHQVSEANSHSKWKLNFQYLHANPDLFQEDHANSTSYAEYKKRTKPTGHLKKSKFGKYLPFKALLKRQSGIDKIHQHCLYNSAISNLDKSRKAILPCNWIPLFVLEFCHQNLQIMYSNFLRKEDGSKKKKHCIKVRIDCRTGRIKTFLPHCDKKHMLQYTTFKPVFEMLESFTFSLSHHSWETQIFS